MGERVWRGKCAVGAFGEWAEGLSGRYGAWCADDRGFCAGAEEFCIDANMFCIDDGSSVGHANLSVIDDGDLGIDANLSDIDANSSVIDANLLGRHANLSGRHANLSVMPIRDVGMALERVCIAKTRQLFGRGSRGVV